LELFCCQFFSRVHWTSSGWRGLHPPFRRCRLARLLALVLVAAILPLHSADEKHIVIYAPSTSFSLPITDRDGREYVGLMESVEPLGAATARTDGLHWKLRYNDGDSEFTAGKNRAKVRGHEIDFPGNFLLENGRGLVPLVSLGTLLPRILGTSVSFNPVSRRLFVGNVATHFTAQLSHTTPPRLVMNFTSPVNPTIATEPGRLRMSFTREPVVAPGTPTLTFDDKAIPSATYVENNGIAEITVNGTTSLMASFSNQGRTITIAPAPAPQPATAAPVQPAQPAGTSPSVPAPAIASAPIPAPARHFYAVIDPSHGGDDRGAALSDSIAEKDVTLALARRLRQEFESRGIPTLVLRDADISLGLDERAALTNTAHPTIYVALHAASDGKGVRLYTSLLPAGGENNGPFLAWDTAQARFASLSQSAAQGVAAEFQRRQVQVRTLQAPLRPLNNLTSAAIAVEVAPMANDVTDLNLAAYQQNVAGAIATAIASMHNQLGGPL
jgi:N-acetylmuramoyl-L-alanine amidase